MENKYQIYQFGQTSQTAQNQDDDVTNMNRQSSNDQSNVNQTSVENGVDNLDLNQGQIELNYTQNLSKQMPIKPEDNAKEIIHELKSKYYDFFKNIIPNPQNYTPQKPSDDEFKRHKIKYLHGNKFYQQLQSYQQPYIRIKNTERQGTIVVYTVVIAIFELEITLLNIDQDSKIQKNKIGSGSFGSVRIQSQNKRMFAVKRQNFKNKYHMKQFNMMANKCQIDQVIKQLAIYKICSMLKIGPAAETDIGFDLICYRDCIEFQIELCMKIEYNSKNDYKRQIYVDESKFEKQIKQCLLTLHFYRIIHKDIKPANILFSIKYNKYVLTDFGISHPIMEKIGYCTITHFQGTEQYISEEMKSAFLKGDKTAFVDLYGNDIHSLSVVLKQKMYNQNIKQQLKSFNQKYNNQHQNKKYEYEYLKLKYYCIKPDSKMGQVQSYWKYMDTKRLDQLIEIVDKSIEYNKIKSVHNYLSKFQKFKTINLDNLRIQSQSIKSLKIEHYIKQNTQLQLKNMSRVYGYSIQVKEMIIQLKLQQKYKQTLETIDKVLNKYNEKYNQRDRMFGDHRKYIKKTKKQLQRFQQQQNNQEIFKRYMIILQYGNTIEQLQTIQKLKKIKYNRKQEQIIEQIIRINIAETKKQNIEKFKRQMDKINKQEEILKEKKLNNDVGRIYEYISNYGTALRYYTKSLNIDIQFYGQQHPNIATRYNNIGMVYDKMGKYETALTYYNKSLNIDISFYGQQHPDIASTYNNIACVYKNMGKYEATLTYFTKSLNIYKSFHGQQHPDIATTFNNIGMIYDSIGKYETAQTYLTKSLNIDRSFFGQKHPTIATRYNNIGMVYNKMGKYETALTYYIKSINIDKLFYGQQYPNVAITYNNIGMVYDKMCKYEKALIFYNKSLNIDTSFHGQQYPDVAIKYNNIGMVYDKMGKYDTALTYYNKSLNIDISFHGQQHPNIATRYNNIASVYKNMGRYDIALTYLVKSLNIDKSFHGQQHPNIATRYNNIASVYDSIGQYEIALRYLTKSLSIDISFFGQKHPTIATRYNNIGMAYNKMGQYETALTYYTMSLNIDISFHGQQHPNIARICNNIAAIYFNLHNFISALKYVYKSLKINLQLFLIKSSLPLIANSYYLLSNIFIKKNKHFKSLYFAYLAVDTFLKFNPLEHSQSSSYILLLARIYYQMNRFLESYFFYRLSCHILVKYFPINHTNVLNVKHMMNEVECSIPQLIHNYTLNIQFMNNICNKYSQLPKHKLIKVLFAKKWQLRFEYQYRSRRDSVEYLKCMIEIYLCYKYLGYLREQQKIGESIKEGLQQFQQSQQKSKFIEFIKEISTSLK